MELDYAQFSWVLETLSTAIAPLAYFVHGNLNNRGDDVEMLDDEKADVNQALAKFMLAVNKYCCFKK